MIAKVRTDDDPPIELTLGDDYRWSSDDAPELAEALTLLHEGTFTPSNGEPGHWQAHDAAGKTGGTVTYLRPAVPAPAGTVY